MGSVAYRPPIWNEVNTTSLLVPPTVSPSESSYIYGIGFTSVPLTPTSQQATLYVFDAVIRLEHAQELVKTSHPIQSGANITDHSYILPAKVILEIGMSDAMDSFNPGMWTGAPSKSVSAYETLLSIQQSRVTVTLNTRLKTYKSMLIASILCPDTNATRHGLKAIVTFEEILIASVTGVSSTVSTLSFRPQTTEENSAGVIQPVNPSDALIQQNNVSDTEAQNYPYIPGAGNWSSNNIATLQQF